MNYNKIYSELIIRAKRRTILPENYKERHHIIPRSMGGTNEKWNIVDLFPEEHLIAHLLLVKIHNNLKMLHAINMMTNMRRVNNKKYGWVKKKFSEERKNFRHTDETKRKISNSKIGYPGMKGKLNPATREDVKEKMRKPKSEQGRQNIRDAIKKQDRTKENNAFYGMNHSKENMIKMVTSRKNNNDGNYHPNGNRTAKTFIFTSPEGEIFEIFNGADRFCISKNISWRIIKKCAGEKYYIKPRAGNINIRTRNSVGWSVIEKKG